MCVDVCVCVFLGSSKCSLCGKRVCPCAFDIVMYFMLYLCSLVYD